MESSRDPGGHFFVIDIKCSYLSHTIFVSHVCFIQVLSHDFSSLNDKTKIYVHLPVLGKGDL